MTSEDEDEIYILHYGTPRHSGRYPWGSGEDGYARSKDFLATVDSLHKQGLSPVEVAKGVGLTTTQLRNFKANAKNAIKAADISRAEMLKAKGLSNIAIGQKMGINESSVRALLKPGQLEQTKIVGSIAERIKTEVTSKKYVDIGSGVEHHMGISRTKFDQAVSRLEGEGYVRHKFSIIQVGTGLKTTMKVLSSPGTGYSEVIRNKGEIRQIFGKSDDGGRSIYGLEKPLSISSKRVGIRYAENGGRDADGVIYVRPNKSDLSLRGKRYAQVRIAVDDTHYLKGMAIHKNDLPEGVDLVFNTNKSNTGNKLDAMKKMKVDKATGQIDWDNPFGAVVDQIGTPIKGQPGRKKITSVMNLVNEEGDWDDWSRSLSTQMLSKQPPSLAARQLKVTLERRKAEFDEIMRATNPEVKRRLLEAFADGVDSAAVHLKAAAMPRQTSRVILPLNSLKPNEIFAPGYRDGENVVLIRYPHGGIFEIPELRVNNKHPEGKELLGEAKDAVGIHSKVAEKLSGADFDGDTVLVIPNPHGAIKTAKSLDGLKGFDPQSAYPAYDGMHTMSGGVWNAKTKDVDFEEGKVASSRTKQVQMGLVSNLITDMTIRGATMPELARAVRHSMVVIDAEKHNLNYQQSAKDNNIQQLRAKYQSKPGSKGYGAATLISNSGDTSTIRVAARRAARVSEGGPIDRVTGKLRYVNTGETYTKNGVVIPKMEEVARLSVVDDAHVYSSGRPIEKLYADHSNALKSMANKARLSMLDITSIPYSPSARKTYANQVESLEAKLILAQKNAPLERQAQIIANNVFFQKKNSNPDMDRAEIKKVKYQALKEARYRTGADKQRIVITPDEWTAIQAGAITKGIMKNIIANTDLEKLKELATPRTTSTISASTLSRAKAMQARGISRAEIADALGISVSTLQNALNPKEE